MLSRISGLEDEIKQALFKDAIIITSQCDGPMLFQNESQKNPAFQVG